MNAFENQVAREASLEAGPSRPVDVASIIRSSTAATPAGRWSVVTRWFGGGGAPSPSEGGISMMSAVKIVAAAAIVALFGGFLLVGVVGDPRDGEPLPPAAESPSAEVAVELPTEFNGTFTCTTYWQDGKTENVVVGSVEGGNLVRRETRGERGSFEAEMSDPRLQGDWTAYSASDEYLWPGIDPDQPLILAPGVMHITNDEGSWQMPWGLVGLPGGMPDLSDADGLAALVGAGAYDGLTALMRFDSNMAEGCSCFDGVGSDRCVWDVQGLIMRGVAPVVEIPE